MHRGGPSAQPWPCSAHRSPIVVIPKCRKSAPRFWSQTPRYSYTRRAPCTRRWGCWSGGNCPPAWPLRHRSTSVRFGSPSCRPWIRAARCANTAPAPNFRAPAAPPKCPARQKYPHTNPQSECPRASAPARPCPSPTSAHPCPARSGQSQVVRPAGPTGQSPRCWHRPNLGCRL